MPPWLGWLGGHSVASRGCPLCRSDLMAALRRRSARAPVVGRRCVAFLRTGAGINWQTRPGRLDWRKLCAENCAPMNALIFSNLESRIDASLLPYSPLPVQSASKWRSSCFCRQAGAKSARCTCASRTLTPEISAERCVAAPDESQHLAGCTSLLHTATSAAKTTLGMEP